MYYSLLHRYLSRYLQFCKAILVSFVQFHYFFAFSSIFLIPFILRWVYGLFRHRRLGFTPHSVTPTLHLTLLYTTDCPLLSWTVCSRALSKSPFELSSQIWPPEPFQVVTCSPVSLSTLFHFASSLYSCFFSSNATTWFFSLPRTFQHQPEVIYSHPTPSSCIRSPDCFAGSPTSFPSRSPLLIGHMLHILTMYLSLVDRFLVPWSWPLSLWDQFVSDWARNLGVCPRNYSHTLNSLPLALAFCLSGPASVTDCRGRRPLWDMVTSLWDNFFVMDSHQLTFSLHIASAQCIIG
jgi:hypothetical protein